MSEGIKYSFHKIETISLEKFGTDVKDAGGRLINILRKIKPEVLSKESYIELNPQANFVRVRLQSIDEKRLIFQIDIFDSYYDIFIDDGIEYDLQVKLKPIDKWIEHIKRLLEAGIVLRFKVNRKGRRISAYYGFYLDNKKITHTSYWSINTLFIKSRDEITFEPWLTK